MPPGGRHHPPALQRWLLSPSASRCRPKLHILCTLTFKIPTRSLPPSLPLAVGCPQSHGLLVADHVWRLPTFHMDPPGQGNSWTQQMAKFPSPLQHKDISRPVLSRPGRAELVYACDWVARPRRQDSYDPHSPRGLPPKMRPTHHMTTTQLPTQLVNKVLNMQRPTCFAISTSNYVSFSNQ